MLDKIKRVISAVSAFAVAATIVSPINTFANEATVAETSFDPETVMWTNNPVENVIIEGGIYKNAAEVNPNASTKDATTVQNPYAGKGNTYNGWEYA